MSIVRSKYLKRAGLDNKSKRKKCRLNIERSPKCNIRFYINNYSFSIGCNDKFIMQSINK